MSDDLSKIKAKVIMMVESRSFDQVDFIDLVLVERLLNHLAGHRYNQGESTRPVL